MFVSIVDGIVLIVCIYSKMKLQSSQFTCSNKAWLEVSKTEESIVRRYVVVAGEESSDYECHKYHKIIQYHQIIS